MSIYDNVVAGLKLTGTRASRDEKDDLVESCLTKAGLWKEVRDRLRAARRRALRRAAAAAVHRPVARRAAPRCCSMDEPCSALDPTSTRVIEETMLELAHEVTIVIVTHNMQQAQRVSQQCAFFLAVAGHAGRDRRARRHRGDVRRPDDPRTHDYVNGRFG